MTQLYLTIKKVWLDQILSGKKKKEYRDIKPGLQSRYLQLDKDGYCIKKNGEFLPREYDQILFKCGEQRVIVEVLGAKVNILRDNKGKVIFHEKGNDRFYAAQVVYDLGKILQR